MTINTELFNKVADKIETDPHLYDQSAFSTICGTAHCIAGWAITIHTGQPDLYEAMGELHSTGSVAQCAADLLGIPNHEAVLMGDGLFEAGWEPHPGLSVPDALRKIGGGDPIESVTDPQFAAHIKRAQAHYTD